MFLLGSFGFLLAFVPFIDTSKSSTAKARCSNFQSLTESASRSLSSFSPGPGSRCFNQPRYDGAICEPPSSRNESGNGNGNGNGNESDPFGGSCFGSGCELL